MNVIRINNYYQLNISIGEYVGVDFGRITGGSSCQVVPDNCT